MTPSIRGLYSSKYMFYYIIASGDPHQSGSPLFPVVPVTRPTERVAETALSRPIIGDAIYVRGRPVRLDEDTMRSGAFLVRDGLLLLRQPAVLYPIERETNLESC